MNDASHEFDPFHLVERLLADTAVARHPRYSGELGSPPAWPSVGPPVAMPARPQAFVGLDEALSGRVSIRSYTSQPVPFPAVTAILEAAQGFDEQTWPEGSRSGPALSLLLLARRVSGLAPSVYAFEPGTRSLLPIAPAPDEAASRELFLQEEFTLAPIVIIVVAPLAAALRAAGSHAYRELLIRAGAAAYGSVLAGLGLGLGGCVFAGLLPSGWGRVIGLEGYVRAALLACAIGHPGEDKVEVWKT